MFYLERTLASPYASYFGGPLFWRLLPGECKSAPDPTAKSDRLLAALEPDVSIVFDTRQCAFVELQHVDLIRIVHFLKR